MNSKLTFIFLFLPQILFAKLTVVTTTPDLAYMARMIGGDKIEVHSLLEGTEDPHFADATPLFMQLSAKADLFLQVGLGLEEGWVPKVLSRSGNKKIQNESEALCTVGTAVDLLDRPTKKINRSMGDVHGEGNPHFHLGPNAFIQGAKKVHQCLSTIAPADKDAFNAGLLKLQNEINDAKIEAEKLLQNKNKIKVAEYHKQFHYFFHEFNIPFSSPLEEIPGVPPSAGRILARANQAKQESLSLMLATNYQNQNVLRKFKELSSVPFVVVPAGLRDNSESGSYKKLIVELAKTLANGN